MELWAALITGIDIVARETMLVAAVGFLVGGLDDLALDLFYLVHRVRSRLLPPAARHGTLLDDYPVLAEPGRIALFVAAWDESAVIGAMLRTALTNIDHPNYRIYVGTYPNDRATVDAVAAVATDDSRVRLVVGPQNGPTTKADCLNALWRALLRDELAEGARAKAILLHDAEDVVHPGELRVIDTLIERHAAVQIPVLPLVAPGSRLVSGHYCDEFAEAHGKSLVVRQALGVGLPLAGVGCAVARAALQRIADEANGAPFDATSLTEDYEMGLHIAQRGGTTVIARVRERHGGPLVAVRAYFPGTVHTAVRQKARWMTGIALSGWDRIGWGRRFDWGDHWMRMRDRRAPVSVIVLAIAYCAIVAWFLALTGHAIGGTAPPPIAPVLATLLTINAGLLAWRLTMRAAFTGLAYGPREAMWSLLRAFVGNVIGLLAARRAVLRYIAMLRGAAPVWDKTAHHFPVQPPTLR